ncbi:MAG: hypothetical protein IPK93_06200 [Solirubrobacterales bacterium]|nr:hypothetical protein [Solirubrobacterales bacterium]
MTGSPDCRLARKDVKVSFKGKARVARRSRRPKRGFFKVSSPTPATFRIQSVKRKSKKKKLLKRRIGAGKSRVLMPYLSAKKFRPRKKYKFLVTLTGKYGGSYKRGFRIKVFR